MRGSLLPAALLCLGLGLMLAFSPPRARLPAFVLLTLAASLSANLPIPGWSAEMAFLACWASLIGACALLHLPRGVPNSLALAVAMIAGITAGQLLSREAHATALLYAVPWALAVFPAAWARQAGWSIAIKVVSSWLVAVALLAALLPISATTPGYIPDHMD